MRAVYICDGIRTPIGRYGGSLASMRPDDMAAHVIQALMKRNSRLDGAAIDDVIMGCANQAGEDNRNVARMAALLAGLPHTVSGTTLNRLCGSGLDAIAMAARTIATGEADVVISGGVESMSRAPFVLPKAATAFDRSHEIFDTTIGWRFINPKMRKLYGVDSMPETAENVAVAYDINRADQDAFAFRSQTRAAQAIARGRFDQEIVPVEIKNRKNTIRIDTDEHSRPDTTVDMLNALPPIVRADGTITAGNSSGVNDGAAALILASEAIVKSCGRQPLARVVGAATAGVEPRLMGVGPVPATQKLLGRLGLHVSSIDLFEVNEAFAAQVLAVTRQLDLPDDGDFINPNGGGIALGHPLGMSGARLAITAAYELNLRSAKRALCTMCIGVGQGIALLLEAA